MKKSVTFAVVALSIAGCNENPANEDAPDPSPDREADSGLTTNSADQTTVMAPDGALDAALPQLVCLGKTGPILERARCGERIGESYGTSTFYAGTDHREAA